MNQDFNDLFKGFEAAFQQTPPVEAKDAPTDAGAVVQQQTEPPVSGEKKELTEEEKKRYIEYRAAVFNYRQKLDRLHEENKTKEEAIRDQPNREKEKKKLEEERNNRLNSLQKEKDSYLRTRKSLQSKLEQQRVSNRNLLHPLERPVVEEGIVSYFINAAQQGYMTKDQLQYMQQDPEFLCGAGRPIGSIKTLKKKEAEFFKTDEFKSLISGRPSDKYIQDIASKISLIISAVLFVVILLGGFKFAFVANIVRWVCFVFFYLIAGVLLTGLCASILNSMKLVSEGVGYVISALAAFCVFAGPISSFLSDAVAGWLSGSIVFSLIVGLLVAFINWIVIYCVFALTPFISWAHKLPFLKTAMIRGTFAELEKTEKLNESIYCVLNHEEICQFFEDISIRKEVAELEEALNTNSFNIREADRQTKSEEQNYSERIAKVQRVLHNLKDKLQAADGRIKQAENDVELCLTRIHKWDKQPELDMVEQYELYSKLCFEGTKSENSVSVRTCTEKGMVVRYYADYGDNSNSAAQMGRAIQKTLSAFTKMNPAEVLSFTVVNLWNGSSLSLFSDIDWMRKQADARGGTGSVTKGTVRLVSNEKELKDYNTYLDRAIESRKSMAMSYDAELQAIRKKNKEDFITLFHLNQYFLQTGKKPMPYQVILLFINNLEGSEAKAFLEKLNGDIVSKGYIPVFFVNETVPDESYLLEEEKIINTASDQKKKTKEYPQRLVQLFNNAKNNKVVLVDGER